MSDDKQDKGHDHDKKHDKQPPVHPGKPDECPPRSPGRREVG